MAELRQSLFALVERPPAPPAPIEVVAARGARYARRRRVLRGTVGLALVGVVSAVGLGLGLGRQGSERGFVYTTEGATTGGYVAEAPGGYVASGVWHITIRRGGQEIEFSSTTSDYCGPIGSIQPGDEVRGSISGAGSTLRVGETFACPN